MTRILSLRADNIKRLVAVEITPDSNWVVISGKNGQGKTSVMDAIWWALGGEKGVQTQPIRKGQKNARVKIALGDENGTELLVERRFTEKGSTLFVRNADGSRRDSGQSVLNTLNGALTFDPVEFMRLKEDKQFAILRSLVPLTIMEGDKEKSVDDLDKEYRAEFEERTSLNRNQAAAQARAEGILFPADLPDEAPDVDGLTQELAELADRQQTYNNETVRRSGIDRLIEAEELEISELRTKINDLEVRVEQRKSLRAALPDREAPPPSSNDLMDRIAAAKAIAGGIANRARAVEEQNMADAYKAEAESKTARLDQIIALKAKALTDAKMPVEGLSFGDGTVMFNGLPLDQASDAEQLRVSVAIAAAMNPKLRIMRIRDGSILDGDARKALAEFAQANDFQIWIEIVDDTGETGVVIEDGHVKGQELAPEAAEQAEAAAPAAVAPSPERVEKAAVWVLNAQEELKKIDNLPEAERLHAKAKVKLSGFPDMLSKNWNPIYTAHIAKLAKKAK